MKKILCKFYIFCTCGSKKQISPIEKKKSVPFSPDSLPFLEGWREEYQKTILESEWALNKKNK